MNVAVLPVSESMLPQIERIEQACFSVPWTPAQLASQLDESRYVFLAAVQDGRVLGYIGMLYVLDEGYISNVAVSPAFRRRGIADKLITELLRRANALSLSFVTLEVRESNIPAIALYENQGFERVGLRKDYYEKPRENALLMTRYFEKQRQET